MSALSKIDSFLASLHRRFFRCFTDVLTEKQQIAWELELNREEIAKVDGGLKQTEDLAKLARHLDFAPDRGYFKALKADLMWEGEQIRARMTDLNFELLILEEDEKTRSKRDSDWGRIGKLSFTEFLKWVREQLTKLKTTSSVTSLSKFAEPESVIRALNLLGRVFSPKYREQVWDFSFGEVIKAFLGTHARRKTPLGRLFITIGYGFRILLLFLLAVWRAAFDRVARLLAPVLRRLRSR